MMKPPWKMMQSSKTGPIREEADDVTEALLEVKKVELRNLGELFKEIATSEVLSCVLQLCGELLRERSPGKYLRILRAVLDRGKLTASAVV